MKYLFFLFLLFSCTHISSDKKSDEVQIISNALTEVRPFLKSDEFRFMDCDKLGSYSDRQNYTDQHDLWKVFGTLNIRKKAIEEGANLLSLHEIEGKEFNIFTADFYFCEKVNSIKSVSHIGMCKPSEEKIFTFNFSRSKDREVGKIYVEQMVKYYGLKNYYKSYAIESIKYSYTHEKYTAKASFFNCF